MADAKSLKEEYNKGVTIDELATANEMTPKEVEDAVVVPAEPYEPNLQANQVDEPKKK